MMFGIGMNEEANALLQKRAHETALPYLKAIGFVEWHTNRNISQLTYSPS